MPEPGRFGEPELLLPPPRCPPGARVVVGSGRGRDGADGGGMLWPETSARRVDARSVSRSIRAGLPSDALSRLRISFA